MTSDVLWSAPALVPVAAAGSRDPAIAVVAGEPHLVWSVDKALYHSSRTGDAWSQPARVATGTQPALAVGPDDRLHCLFANEFAGNSEIFHVYWDGSKWSLPVNVSRTTGASTQPVLAAGADGGLHGAWTDTTPGSAVIYYGRQEGAYWTSVPIPSAQGSTPTIAVTKSGDIYVAFQDWLPESSRYEVYCAICSNAKWTPPENVSDSPNAHSILPSLAAPAEGDCHMVWQEEKDGLYYICYSQRRPGGWSIPEPASEALADCRAPQIAMGQGFDRIVWLEGQDIKHRARTLGIDTPWRAIETVPATFPPADRLVLVLSSDGTLHAAAGAADRALGASLFYTSRAPLLSQHIFLPFILQV